MTFGLKPFISTTHGAINGFLNAGDTITFRADFDSATPVDALIGPPSLSHDFLPDGLELTIGNNTRNAEFVSVDEKGVTFKYTVTAQDQGAISIERVNLSIIASNATDAFDSAVSPVVWNDSLKVDNALPKAPSAELVPETTLAQDPETHMISEVPTGKYTEIHVSNVPSDCAWRFSMDGGKTWVDGVGNTIHLTGGQTWNAGDVLVQSVSAAGNHSSSVSINTSFSAPPTSDTIVLQDNGTGGVVEGQAAHFVVNLPQITGNTWTKIEVLGADGKGSQDAYFWNDRTKITDQDGHLINLYYGNMAILNPSITKLYITVDTVVDNKVEGAEAVTLHVQDYSGKLALNEYATFNVYDPKPITSTITQVSSADGTANEGDSVIFKLQFSEALRGQSWTQFTVSDGSRATLWNDQAQYSFDGGITWGGKPVYYGNCLILDKGTESVLVKVATRFDADGNDNSVSLMVNDTTGAFVPPASKTVLIHDTSPTATLSYVPDANGMTTESESAIFKLQFSKALQTKSWTQFTLSGDSSASLWNDQTQYSYDDGQTWGGKPVYYGNCLILDKGTESVLIKVATRVKADNADHTLMLNVNDTSGAFIAPTSVAVTIHDNAGNDSINGTQSNDYLEGGKGNDSLYGGAGDDVIDEDGGGTKVGAEWGNDYIDAGSGNDIAYAGDGNDTLIGGAGNDVLYGEAGNDSLSGGDGNDTLFGGDATDHRSYFAGSVQNSMSGSDTIDGGAGDDRIFAGRDNALMSGGAGNDTLVGNAGNDTLDGGADVDTLTGGLGADRFIISGTDSDNNADIITDFNKAEGDQIVLDSKVFDKLKGLTSLVDHFCLSTQVQDSDDYLIYNANTGELFYDGSTRGDGPSIGGGFGPVPVELIATLTNKPQDLTAQQFVVI